MVDFGIFIRCSIQDTCVYGVLLCDMPRWMRKCNFAFLSTEFITLTRTTRRRKLPAAVAAASLAPTSDIQFDFIPPPTTDTATVQSQFTFQFPSAEFDV